MNNKNNSNNIINEASDLTTSSPSKISQLLACIPFNIFSGKPVVAVLRLEGIIGKSSSIKSGLSIASLNKLIEQAFDLERLVAVCLVINSPGGSPVQSELIADRIIKLGKEKKVPVYSFVEDVAASGGYWLACAGEKIYASMSSIIGSVGVIASGFGFDKAISKIGVERRVYTQGNNKSVLDPFQPEKASDVKIIKRIQQQVHEYFIDHVKSRRGNRLTQSDELLFNGEFWTGQTALDYGLIDGINDLYSFIKHKFDDDVKIEYIEPRQTWFKKKLGLLGTMSTGGNDSMQWTHEITKSVYALIEERYIANKFDLS